MQVLRADGQRMFQSLVGAMRTNGGPQPLGRLAGVSIPRRGNEDPVGDRGSTSLIPFQSLVGAMRTLATGARRWRGWATRFNPS